MECAWEKTVFVVSAAFDYDDSLMFFFQAEDGIRDLTVTGVQTCALPISGHQLPVNYPLAGADAFRTATGVHAAAIIKAQRKGDRWLADRVYSGVPAGEFGKIGRASCRERV